MTYLIIPGLPVAQPRQRHKIICGHVSNYTPAASPVSAFKAAVRLCWQQFCGDVAPLTGPVYIGVDFIFPMPQSRRKKRDAGRRMWCEVKPDADNLLKSLLDALAGLAFCDDKQVSMVRLAKFWAADGESARTELTVLPAQERNYGEVS